MRGPLLEQLVDAVDTLMQAKGREVLKSALGLIKVLCTVIPDAVLAPHVEKLVSLCLSFSKDYLFCLAV